jgi:inner membrane protein involved in colicin E2 resistance
MITIGRVIAIILVFVGACIGWLILGATTNGRSYKQNARLGPEVQSLWGQQQRQMAPTFNFRWQTSQVVERTEEGEGKHSKRVIRETAWTEHTKAILPASTHIEADIHLDQRLKGLLWYSLYDTIFDGRWTYVHEDPHSGTLDLAFSFPVPDAMYDDFKFIVDGRDLAAELRPDRGTISTSFPLMVGQKVSLAVHYKSRGRDQWEYQPAMGVASLRDFNLTIRSDFMDIDYPQGTSSPSKRQQNGKGWTLHWNFRQTVTGQGMGLVMPERIQPGELATQLIATAPISLLLFFILLFALSILQKLDIHPANYLAIAGAFFSFHLLFAYCVDHLHITAALIVASAASIIMVVSYMRLVVSSRFAFREVVLAQLVYQVGFSLAHFAHGYTGLTISVLATLTLFTLMMLTGRIRWSTVFAKRDKCATASSAATP